MPTSRLNALTLVAAFIAGLVALRETQNLLATLAGLALLVALFAYDRRGGRTGMQSLAFAFVCGLALLCACSYPLLTFLPSLGLSPSFLDGQFPALFWLAATAAFWFIDRSRIDSRQAAVSQIGYAQSPFSQGDAPQPVPLRTFAPEPAPPPAPEPILAWNSQPSEPLFQPEPAYPPPPPPVAATAPAPAPLSGKEVGIYVTMLGEGMNVLRAVRAEHLGRDFYLIVDEMPADETWQYVPGQVVRCRKKNLSNGKGLVAYEEAPRAQ